MTIINSRTADFERILDIYQMGIEYQKSVFHKSWLGFDKELLVREIEEKRHWKITNGEEIACVFSVLFEDPVVWGSEDTTSSIYLHRIVTNPFFRGNHYVLDIVNWAREYGRKNGMKFIRLDTFPDNQKLNQYYLDCGFRFCGLKQFGKAENIPEHYRDGLSLFEMPVG
jgi:RimJ/RimL family protein N-acetyltransferase